MIAVFRKDSGEIEFISESKVKTPEKSDFDLDEPEKYGVLEIPSDMRKNMRSTKAKRNWCAVQNSSGQWELKSKIQPTFRIEDDFLHIPDNRFNNNERIVVARSLQESSWKKPFQVTLVFEDQYGNPFYPKGNVRISDRSGVVELSDPQCYLDGSTDRFRCEVTPRFMSHACLDIRFHRDYDDPKVYDYMRIRKYHRFDIVSLEKYNELSGEPRYVISVNDGTEDMDNDGYADISADAQSSVELKIQKLDKDDQLIDCADNIKLVTSRGKLSTETLKLQNGEAVFSLIAVPETVIADVKCYSLDSKANILEGNIGIHFSSDL